jgi:hypothetical protein
MLFTLGLRIERLLYFSFILLLICALQVYLAAAATYFNSSDTRVFDQLIEQLQKNERELRNLYETSQKPRLPLTEKEKSVAAMRESLGLPLKKSDAIDNEPTYKSRLQDIFISLPDWSDVRTQLEGTLNTTKPPDRLLADLNELRLSKIKERGTVLGIEIPRLLTLQYGSADLRVSAQHLALALFVALFPLSFVWMGSFFITRQRELLGIRAARDYKEAFPHILNFVAVDFSPLHQRLGVALKPKEARLNMRVARFVTTGLRCLFVTVTVLPLVAGLGYSGLQLYDLLNPSTSISVLLVVSYIALALLSIFIVLQEAFALRGKSFYE